MNEPICIPFAVYTAWRGYGWSLIPEDISEEELGELYHTISERRPDFMGAGDSFEGVYYNNGLLSSPTNGVMHRDDVWEKLLKLKEPTVTVKLPEIDDSVIADSKANPADVTMLLDIPVAKDGIIGLTKATVKEYVVREILDPDEGAEIELNAEIPSIATAKAKPGLLCTFREGVSLEGLVTKEPDETKIVDGEAWKPTIKVKGGVSGFYSFGVSK